MSLTHLAFIGWLKTSLLILVCSSLRAQEFSEFFDFISENPPMVLKLPVDYPHDLQQNERCFTGELYTKQYNSAIDDNNYLFIPQEYAEILVDASSIALINLLSEKYSFSNSKLNQLLKENILVIKPHAFGYHSNGNYEVNLTIELYNIKTGQLVTTVTKSLSQKRQIKYVSVTKNEKVFLIGNHRYNFHPERKILMQSSLQLFTEFFEEI